MKTKGKPRNRATEARAKGRVLRAFELSTEADGLIDVAARGLAGRQQAGSRGVTRVEALEWLIRQGVKRFQKKSDTGLDTD